MFRLIPPWVYGIAAALALAAAFGAGFKVASWRCDAAKLKAVKEAIKQHDRQRAQVHKEASDYENDREQGRVEAADREGQIRTVFRDREVPGDCAAPEPVRSVLDDAIRSANARARGEPGAGLPAAAEPAAGS